MIFAANAKKSKKIFYVPYAIKKSLIKKKLYFNDIFKNFRIFLSKVKLILNYFSKIYQYNLKFQIILLIINNEYYFIYKFKNQL